MRLGSVIHEPRRSRSNGQAATVAREGTVPAFSDLLGYRARLNDIARRVAAVTGAWARSDLADADRRLAAIRYSAEHLRVPAGCEPAQRALRDAFRTYRAAKDRLSKASSSHDQAQIEAAWEQVKDGDALLSLALELARKG